MSDQQIIKSIRCWVEQVVIGENFCPFAKPVFDAGSIRYRVVHEPNLEVALFQLIEECKLLDLNNTVETSLVIFSKGFDDFELFLDLIALSDQLLVEQGYEGVYQLAHFHPDYCFNGIDFDDAQNFTNRAPFPVLHLLREDAMEQILSKVKAPESIPERNIRHARKLGAKVLSERLRKCKSFDEDPDETI